MQGGQRKGAGRPENSSKADTRDKRVYVRVTGHEKRAIEEWAARAGTSVSEYLLTKALQGKAEDGPHQTTARPLNEEEEAKWKE